ncbi:hypothetical protein I6A60_04040 [Frankia sp. AgB1.9]|uniref:hypothetical protein n=1 Tax=unclassified Frankia TaxID=2632575 RepID=UPI001933F07C|nr:MULTISPECIES: hypothetical protein [unclassified Frankia]MBL7492454.1 hypothetical protein [Frankia sp. AgW1.1]MBL7547054.1 hypothetical protein [Frankia sp. AgB1.9]MBL7619345.1 hypothetical protein [Frankia sp. AgB1.8]
MFMIQSSRRGPAPVATFSRQDILAAELSGSRGGRSTVPPGLVQPGLVQSGLAQPGRARGIAVLLAAGLVVGGLAGCGQHHPPKPTNLTCAANYSVQWSGKHDRWECLPNKSSSNSGNSSSNSSRRGNRRH